MKGKNGLPLAGIPLLAYSVAAALESRKIDRIICSTDVRELAELARVHGAEVPFIRPPELALDDTRDLPVFQHALDWLAENDCWSPDVVVHLRPTSPLRKPGQVNEAVDLLERVPAATCVRTVCLAPSNPHKMWRLQESSPFMRNLLDIEGVAEPFNEPRQCLPEIYWQTGTIDVVRSQVIRSGSMTGDRILPLVIDPAQAVDIDIELDMIFAGLILERGGYIRPNPVPSPAQGISVLAGRRIAPRPALSAIRRTPHS